MYLLDSENGNVVDETKEIELNYILDTTKTTCTSSNGVTASVTEENHKIKLTSNGSVNCRVYFYSKPIYCIDEQGKTINCPDSWKQGDRIAIGIGSNRQTFRYLRTTDTTSNLNECETTSSEACSDTDSRNNIGANKLRFMAEYNLKRTGEASSNSAIASDALQDLNDSGSTNSVQFGTSTDYNTSYLKQYLENYQSILNSMIGQNNVISVNTMTYPEIRGVDWGCPASGTGTCSSIPSWASNSRYWLSSAFSNTNVWRVYDDSRLSNAYRGAANAGARPVIMISIDDFIRLK